MPRTLGAAAVGLSVCLAFGGEAFAGCAPGPAGPLDYVCTGTFGAQTLLTPASVALVGAKATGGITFNYAGGGGDANFSMDANSSITASGNGVTMVTTAGHVDMTTPGGQAILGPITSTAGIAILAGASGAGNNVNIVTGAKAVIAGATGGIAATSDGTGEINLSLAADVTAKNGPAIAAQAVDGAINITQAGKISGGAGGILATTIGAGLIAIDTASTVSATTWTAISASAAGTGDVTIYAGDAVSSAANGVLPPGAGWLGGIYGSSAGGNVTITTLDTVDAASGIYASTSGKGAANITTGDTVTARSGDGVTASSVDGDSLVQIGVGGVKAQINGVSATASGLGNVVIGIHGDVAATDGVGVSARSASGKIEIDLDKGTFVSGAVAGVSIATDSGTAILRNAANIAGTGLVGDGVVIDANAGAVTVENKGVIESIANAINVKSGAALIRNTGTIDGVITSAAGTVATLNNDGVWSNAAGSTLAYLNNTGTISFGANNGTTDLITISGDANFASTSTINMRVAATTVGGVTTVSTDAIVVKGQTTINGGYINLSGPSTGLARGMTFTLLSSTGGITGAFSGVASSMNDFTGFVTNDPNNIYLTLLGRDFRGYALNRNQYAAANGIWMGSAVLSNPAGVTLMQALNNSSDGEIPIALTQISGDGIVSGANNAALQAGHMFTGAMADQSAIWRSNGLNPVNSITLTEPFPYAPVQTAGSKWPVSRQQYAPAPVRPAGQRTWRVWATGFGGQSNFAGGISSGAGAQTTSIAGGAIGLDYQVGQNMLIGVAAGYSGSAWSTAGTNVSGSNSGLQIGIYTGFKIGAFYADASVAWGDYQNKTKRTVAVGGVSEAETGNFSTSEMRSRIEIGRRMSFEAMTITPFAAVEIAHAHSGSFAERGIATTGQVGVYSLAFAGQGAYSTPTFIGLRVESRLDAGTVALTPWISLAWRHEWSATRNQTATLVSLPGSSFVAIGAKPAYDALQLKAGAQVQVSKNAALFAAFEGELLTKTPVYSGKGGFRVGW
ncbi:MAG: autotransporter domain-containing protein [Beijerinckiaceae bacterium]